MLKLRVRDMKEEVCVVGGILELARCKRPYRPIAVLEFTLVLDCQMCKTLAVHSPELSKRIA